MCALGGGETADWTGRGIDFRTRCRYARPLIRLRLGEARLPSALPALFPPTPGRRESRKLRRCGYNCFLFSLIFFFSNGMLTAGRWHADVSLKLRAGGQAVRFRKKSPAEGLRAVVVPPPLLHDERMRRRLKMASLQDATVPLGSVVLC